MNNSDNLKPTIKLCSVTTDMRSAKVASKESLVIDFTGITKQKNEEDANYFDNRKVVQVIIEMADLPYIISDMQSTVEAWASKKHEEINRVQCAFKNEQTK